jgi:hypothetical protein
MNMSNFLDANVWLALPLHPTPFQMVWADAYLLAFAEAAGLTLVTFDGALASRSKTALILTGGDIGSTAPTVRAARTMPILSGIALRLSL